MTDPTTPQPIPPESVGVPRRTGLERRWWYLAIGAAAVLALVVFLVAQAGDDGGDQVSTPTGGSTTTASPGSTTTASPTTTLATTTTTTAVTSTTVAEPPIDRSTVIWPDVAAARLTDPIEAARGFATSYLGFTNPVVGAFQSGDARSGEVLVRPEATGPVTTILVRQLADDAWYVLGAATTGITLAKPAAMARVTSPVALQGSALAFEGQVAVEIRQDGSRSPIGESFVTGGGDIERPFEGSISYADPAEPAGAIVLIVRSARDGSIWQAAAVRVRLG